MVASGKPEVRLLHGLVTIRSLPVYREIPSTPVTQGGRLMLPAGELAQISNGAPSVFLAYLEFRFESQRPRGNHFHRLKTENLYLVAGRLRAFYIDVATGERAEVVVEAGDLVRVLPGCAHAYVPLEYAQAVEFSDRAFDAADTIAHAVVPLTP